VTPADVAEATLPLLRALAAIADASLDAAGPQLSLQQYRAVVRLHEHGPHNAAALAAALGIAPSTLTRLADRLVRDGLVDRVADASDRRAVMLSASRRGAQTVERVKAWRLAELTRRYDAVPDEDRADLLEALERCRDAIEPRST
jgi:DNA-binding MarR family transcriptional regulator